MKSIVFTTATLLSLTGAGAMAEPVKLTAPNMANHVRQISNTPNGDLCIVGQTYDPEGDQRARGKIIMFSTAQNKVLWQQVVEAPDGAQDLRFISCRSDGTFTYVAANVDTHSSRTLNQALAYLYKFDGAGKVLAKSEALTGANNSFVYDVDVDAKGVMVVGMAHDTTGAAEKNAIFFARFDAALKGSGMNKLATGAYDWDSTARLANNVVQLAGNFHAASVPKDDLADDYAISKIVGGKYQFSVRPQRMAAYKVVSAISPGGDVISIGDKDRAGILTAVNPEGKTVDNIAVKSTLCEVTSLSADGNVVYAVRRACGKSKEAPKLVAIDRKTGAESAIAGVVGEPLFVFPVAKKLYVISQKGRNSGLLLDTIARGE